MKGKTVMSSLSLFALVALIALSFMFLWGRAFAQAGAEGNLSPADVASLLEEGKITLIDVREQNEFDLEHISGAVLMPLSSFDASKIPSLSQGKPVVLYCRSGRRSGVALKQALNAGVAQQMMVGAVKEEDGQSVPVLAHMAGGINAWKSQRLGHLEKTEGLTDCLLCKKK